MEKEKTAEANATANKKAEFYADLVDLEDKLLSIEWNEVLTDEVKARWLEGKPVLTLVQPRIDQKRFSEVLNAVVRACLKRQPGPQPLSEEILPLIEGLTGEEPAELQQAVIKNDAAAQKQWADKLNISEEMFRFLADNTARLFLRSYAAAVSKQLPWDKWSRGYCPVCGERPVMAKLTGKYGKRRLYCGRCESEWGYLRIGCPYCGTQDSDKLSFVTPEGYKQYRLYLCENCKTYLKTVDERECGEVDLFCEDAATSDFDKLAVSEGYHRGDEKNCV